jgi:biopolymer transport protein ExbB
LKDGETLPQDATAYATHAVDSKAQIEAAGWIGAAAKFTGAGPITIEPVPQLAIAADKGWTFSTWNKFDQPQDAASLLDAHDGGQGLSLDVQGAALVARWTGANESVDIAPPPATLIQGTCPTRYQVCNSIIRRRWQR